MAQALAEQERVADDLTRLIDTANAPIIGIDAHGRVNEWNQTTARLTGFTKVEVLGRDLVGEFITDDFKDSVRQVLELALNGQETSNYEFPLFSKQGARIDVLLNSTTRRDATGSVIGVVGVGKDITDLAQALAEQERVADDLTRLIDTANAPIIGIDAHGRVNEWNQTTARLTGFTRVEVLGKDLVDELITDDFKDSVREVLERALNGQETSNYEFPLFTKQGGRIDVLLNSTTRRDTQGSVTGVIGIGKDVTVLRRQQKRLQHAEKMESVGALAGRIAHDFNNLLAVVKGNIAFVLESIPDSDDSEEAADNRECLSDAETATANAVHLTKRLLTFSSQQALRYERLNIRSVIDNALPKTSPLVPQKFDFSVNIDEVDVMALADRIQFEGALTNILNNAQDASDDGGGIFVEAHIKHLNDALAKEHAVQVGAYIVVVVRDNGCGIPEGSLSRVTDPFFTTKMFGKHEGLGLSMVHGFVNHSGGYIDIKSELGVGTSVTLALPFDTATIAAPEEKTSIPNRKLPQQPGTVLIVDDEERLLKVAVRILGSLGFRVLVSGDAHQALEVLASHGDEIDIMFSDIMMPGDMTGRQLAAEVMKSHPSIRILLTTGYEQAGPSPENTRLPEWQVPVLRKPYSKEELVTAITERFR